MSPGAIDREDVSSVDVGDDAQSDVSMLLSRFQPLNRPVTHILWWSRRRYSTYPFESHSGLLRTAFHMSNISPAFSRRSPIA